ncbi:hypothetical protein EW146_g10292, partial [Bondarzewia mesenterica]
MTFFSFWNADRWDPSGKHVYITGGSSGLGLALAKQLAAEGAHVSIVARDKTKLALAHSAIQVRRPPPPPSTHTLDVDALATTQESRLSPTQTVQSFSYALSTSPSARAALADVVRAHGGRAPDAVFLCAGASTPKFFLEYTDDELAHGMDAGYWAQVWTARVSVVSVCASSPPRSLFDLLVRSGRSDAQAAARLMASQSHSSGRTNLADGTESRKASRPKVIFVSSTLGLMTLPGYAAYVPAKHALRGLADMLRVELALYDIDVHAFFPPTMFTPGYEAENACKPAITLRLEEADSGLEAVEAAAILVEGVKRGRFQITGNFITELFRASSRAASPRRNWFVDALLDVIAFIAVPIWVAWVDRQVRAHRAEHRKWAVASGVLDVDNLSTVLVEFDLFNSDPLSMCAVNGDHMEVERETRVETAVLGKAHVIDADLLSSIPSPSPRSLFDPSRNNVPSL